MEEESAVNTQRKTDSHGDRKGIHSPGASRNQDIWTDLVRRALGDIPQKSSKGPWRNVCTVGQRSHDEIPRSPEGGFEDQV